MHISNIYRAPQMGYLEGKGGRYVSRRSISEAKSLIYVLVKANNEFTHLRLAFLGREKALWPLFTLGFVGAGFTLWYIKR